MFERCKYTIKITLKSPFMFQGLVNTRVGADVAALRDEEDHAIIPAAQMRGVLRAACAILQGENKSVLAKLFGKSSAEENSNYNPERGAIIFSDLKGPKPTPKLLTTRIEINDETGVVKTGALQVIELVKPFEELATFEGSIIIKHFAGLSKNEIVTLLEKALKLIPAMGAFKSVGFGEVISEDCEIKLQEARELGFGVAKSGERLAIDMSFDRPIIVDTERVAHNVYKGSSIVPGATLKGALAEELKFEIARDPALNAALANLYISHAFPISAQPDTLANYPIPMSVITFDEGKSFEDILVNGDQGKAPHPKNDEVATYVHGAKTEIKNKFRKISDGDMEIIPEIEHKQLPRIHIAIDADSQTATDKMLYSTISVGTKDKKWRVSVDAGKVDPAYSRKLLGTLLRGLDGVGRGESCATFENTREEAPPLIDADQTHFNLTLLTPAVMFDPLAASPTMFERYTNYWHENFDGAEMQNMLVRRRMAGGYLGMRHKLYGEGTYYPFILTEPGSVFRIAIKTPKARAAMEDALRYGLPVPKFQNGTVEATWENCPFVRENGYGQIKHNLIPHEKLGADVKFMEVQNVR